MENELFLPGDGFLTSGAFRSERLLGCFQNGIHIMSGGGGLEVDPVKRQAGDTVSRPASEKTELRCVFGQSREMDVLIRVDSQHEDGLFFGSVSGWHQKVSATRQGL